ncbi:MULTISPECIES: NAD-dependent epimerase/dehydratase family protein [Delftia]|uniref:NAD-dependent epimerase/dehydratase family protein n=1 Tax=Delftia TaxID=80865 RepID=UPI000774AF04|nr:MULTISPECIES: NAD-dependent epimerase/dehydratase family protein [Delftia]MPT54162.1 NAD-dependent epimerase/dehydratase family protein [Delftia sp.]SFB62749.1 Nucleoside-diphosphate-sugar epimerase [Delftia tsuruhatensis]
MPSIALFGAAGAIGQSLAAALRQQGRAYRVVGRSEASLRQTFGADPLAEIVPWNPDSTGSVEAAAHGVDTLVYLVGVNYWQFALHPELMRRTLDGAIAAGVRRIVLIGTVYPYGKAQAHAVKEDHPRNPHTFKGRMRKAQEDLLLQAHAQGRIEAAVLRLPDFYGPGVHNSLLHGAFEAAARGGRADMVGPLDRPHEFVYVPDVGPVVARLIGTPQAFGKVWHLAGAGAITQRDVVSEIERLSGRPLKLRVAGKTALRLTGLFNPFMRELAEMHYLLTDPLIMEDSALHALLGPIAKTPYAQGIRATLNAAMASADSHLAAA